MRNLLCQLICLVSFYDPGGHKTGSPVNDFENMRVKFAIVPYLKYVILINRT